MRGSGVPIWFQAFTAGSRATTGRPFCVIAENKLTPFRGVGFLKYWTLSNLPLFLLATPMLCILSLSAWAAGTQTSESYKTRNDSTETFRWSQWNKGQVRKAFFALGIHDQGIARRLALPQIILTISALFLYHVQVITRLASGYPIWYLWLASMILDDPKIRIFGKERSLAKIIVRWMVCYAIFQGCLFASFLPPA